MRLRNPLFWIVLLAIILRLGALWFTLENRGPEIFIEGDAIGYMELAENIASGNGFSILKDGETVPEIFRAPGFPVILSLFAGKEGGALAYAIFFSILAGLLLPLLTYKIGKLIVGRTPALIAATLIAIEPRLVLSSFLLASEIPYIIFSLAGVYLALMSFHKNLSFVVPLVAGVLLGYSILIRPPFYYVSLTALLVVILWNSVLGNKRAVIHTVLVLAGIFCLLSPWLIRNYNITESVAISGMGWRNVYTDYLGSVRALDNNSAFSIEKAKLKEEAKASGIDYDNPAVASELQKITLPELWDRRATVIKLETFLLTSFFMHDGYFYSFNRHGFISGARGESHSVSFALLTQGMDGIHAIFTEMKRQYFIPLFGRLFTIGLTLLALWGAWIERKNPLVLLLVFLIGFTALISTANGLGVNARLRFPVAPYIFMLAGISLAYLPTLWNKYRSWTHI